MHGPTAGVGRTFDCERDGSRGSQHRFQRQAARRASLKHRPEQRHPAREPEGARLVKRPAAGVAECRRLVGVMVVDVPPSIKVLVRTTGACTLQ